MNSARKENLEEVIRERQTDGATAKKERHFKTKKEIREEESNVNLTAEEAQEVHRKKHKKSKQHGPEGHELWQADATYRSIKKRV